MFVLCYTTYLDIATQADIKTTTCDPKTYTLLYVVKGTFRYLMRHICSIRIIETLKAHNISSGGSYVAHKHINTVRTVKKVMDDQFLSRIAKT